MNKNKTIIDCFVHVPNTSSNGPPIQWMEIKDFNDDDKILLYIPYTKFNNNHNVKNFKDAVYKNLITFNEDDILNLIEEIYVKYKSLLLHRDLLDIKKQREIILNINLKKSNLSWNQLYFLNKICLIGVREEIDNTKMIIKLDNI